MREGRFFLYPICLVLYFISIHIESYAFLNIILFVTPNKFINNIWSRKEEIDFYLLHGRKAIVKTAMTNNILLVIEQNIMFVMSFIIHSLIYGFISINLNELVVLNIILNYYMSICCFLFFLNGSFRINYQVLFIGKLVVLFFSSFVILLTLSSLQKTFFYFSIFLIVVFLYKYSFKLFVKNISLKKIIKYAGN
jgi:hypothetical protein